MGVVVVIRISPGRAFFVQSVARPGLYRFLRLSPDTLCPVNKRNALRACHDSETHMPSGHIWTRISDVCHPGMPWREDAYARRALLLLAAHVVRGRGRGRGRGRSHPHR